MVLQKQYYINKYLNPRKSLSTNSQDKFCGNNSTHIQIQEININMRINMPK